MAEADRRLVLLPSDVEQMVREVVEHVQDQIRNIDRSQDIALTIVKTHGRVNAFLSREVMTAPERGEFMDLDLQEEFAKLADQADRIKSKSEYLRNLVESNSRRLAKLEAKQSSERDQKFSP